MDDDVDDGDDEDDEAWEVAPTDSNRGTGTEGNAGEGSGTVKQHHGTRMDSRRSQAAASPEEVAEGDSAVKPRCVGDGDCRRRRRRCLRCCP